MGPRAMPWISLLVSKYFKYWQRTFGKMFQFEFLFAHTQGGRLVSVFKFARARGRAQTVERRMYLRGTARSGFWPVSSWSSWNWTWQMAFPAAARRAGMETTAW